MEAGGSTDHAQLGPVDPLQDIFVEEWLAFIGRNEGKHLLAALSNHHCLQVKDQHSKEGSSSKPFIMLIDEAAAFELAAANPRLLGHVLAFTDAYTAASTTVLCQQGLIEPNTRVWIRLKFAPVHHTTLDSLLSAVAAHGPHAMSYTGVVQALSTCMQRVHSRSFKCTGCSALCQALVGQEPACENGCYSGWVEMLEGRVMVAVQEIWLSDFGISTPGPSPFFAKQQSIRATLVDELAGSSAVCIGAAVTVVGHVRCVPDAAAGFGKGSKALGTASITASSLTPSCAQAPWADVELLQGLQFTQPSIHPLLALVPASTASLDTSPISSTSLDAAATAVTSKADAFGSCQGSPLLAADPSSPLQSLANALMEAQGCCLDPCLALALLISSAVSGTGMQLLQIRDLHRARGGAGAYSSSDARSALADSIGIAPACTIESAFAAAGEGSLIPPHPVPANQPQARERCSISLLVLHEACDPFAARALRASATLLSPHSIAPGSANVLQDLIMPQIEKLATHTDASTAEGVLKVSSSALTRANAGVLVLDGSTFVGPGIPSSKTRVQQLHAAMLSGIIALDRRNPQLQVPVLATVWATSAQPSSVARAPAAASNTFIPDSFSLVLHAALDDTTVTRCVLNAGEDVRGVGGAGMDEDEGGLMGGGCEGINVSLRGDMEGLGMAWERADEADELDGWCGGAGGGERYSTSGVDGDVGLMGGCWMEADLPKGTNGADFEAAGRNYKWELLMEQQEGGAVYGGSNGVFGKGAAEGGVGRGCTTFPSLPRGSTAGAKRRAAHHDGGGHEVSPDQVTIKGVGAGPTTAPGARKCAQVQPQAQVQAQAQAQVQAQAQAQARAQAQAQARAQAQAQAQARAQAEEVAAWRRALQHHMALVAHTPMPLVSMEAQEILRAYVLSVRSTAAGIHVHELLQALINLATACARLLLRSTAVAHPDCTVALMLMEQTIANKQQLTKNAGYLNLGLPSIATLLAEGISSTLDEGLLIISEQAISQLGAFGLHIACCSEKAEEAGVDGPHLMSRKKPRPFGQGPEN